MGCQLFVVIFVIEMRVEICQFCQLEQRLHLTNRCHAAAARSKPDHYKLKLILVKKHHSSVSSRFDNMQSLTLFCVLLCIYGIVALPQKGHGGYKPEPVGPAVYKYGYAVKDDYSGNNYGQSESRDGYATSGSYYVQLPDGRVQKVRRLKKASVFKFSRMSLLVYR